MKRRLERLEDGAPDEPITCETCKAREQEGPYEVYWEEDDSEPFNCPECGAFVEVEEIVVRWPEDVEGNTWD